MNETDVSKVLVVHAYENKRVQAPSVGPYRPALHFLALSAGSSLQAHLEKQA